MTAIKPKAFSDHSDIDVIFEQALEWQERGRQNHGLTLDITTCINYVVKKSCANEMQKVADNLAEIIKLATAEPGA